MKKSTIALAVVGALSAVPAIASDWTFTGNATALTDYRFRGISQTLKGPAFQGGFDAAHKSGFYVGNWNSNVSSNQFAGGPGIEMDFYGGYKGEYKGVGYDIGNLYYYYGDARTPTVPSFKYDNNEVYVSLSYGPLSGKFSYATTDYFGIKTGNGSTIASETGSSRGTTYSEINFSKEILPKWTAIAHVGYTEVKNYQSLSYGDYKIGVSYDLNGFALGASVIGTEGGSSAFRAANTTSFFAPALSVNGKGETKKLYDTAIVLSIGKTF